jgi:hypothetical protein
MYHRSMDPPRAGVEETGAGAGPRLRGQLFLACLGYIKEHHGVPGLQAVLADLSEADRTLLRGLERDGWYPFGALNRLAESAARTVACGDTSIYERLGAASARDRTEWLGPDARLYSVHGFLGRVAEEHRRFHDFGEAVYTRGGFHDGALAFSAYPEVHPSFCRASVGYFRSAVEFLTAGPVAVEETTCQCRRDPTCRFLIRWVPPAPRPL